MAEWSEDDRIMRQAAEAYARHHPVERLKDPTWKSCWEYASRWCDHGDCLLRLAVLGVHHPALTHAHSGDSREG